MTRDIDFMVRESNRLLSQDFQTAVDTIKNHMAKLQDVLGKTDHIDHLIDYHYDGNEMFAWVKSSRFVFYGKGNEVLSTYNKPSTILGKKSVMLNRKASDEYSYPTAIFTVHECDLPDASL